MVQKEHLLTKLVFVCFIIFGCSNHKDKKIVANFEKVDLSKIPNRTIFKDDSELKLLNGVYHLNDKLYSGFIKEMYATDSIKSIGSYLFGKQHGVTKTFFTDGSLESERNYKNGLAYGKHIAYWENGNLKYEFNYFNDQKEGIQKHWYISGNKYYELNFNNDRENGMQKAWRDNGKAYINYEAKDGERYGLQKASLCYTLKDEEIK